MDISELDRLDQHNRMAELNQRIAEDNPSYCDSEQGEAFNAELNALADDSCSDSEQSDLNDKDERKIESSNQHGSTAIADEIFVPYTNGDAELLKITGR